MGYIIGLAVSGTVQGSIGFLGLFGIFAIGWSIIGYYTGDKMSSPPAAPTASPTRTSRASTTSSRR